MAEAAILHHRRSVQTTRVLRLMIALPIALLMLWSGVVLLSPDGFFRLKFETLGSALRVIGGHFLLVAGLLGTISELVRGILARRNSGVWEITLTPERLDWQAPKHPFGRELSFRLDIPDIDHTEIRTDPENANARSYWLVPALGEPVRLSNASGINLDHLLEKLEDLGVPRRTIEV